jgi:hypothetical protein
VRNTAAVGITDGKLLASIHSSASKKILFRGKPTIAEPPLLALAAWKMRSYHLLFGCDHLARHLTQGAHAGEIKKALAQENIGPQMREGEPSL